MAECEEESDGDHMTTESLKLYEAQFFGFTPQTCTMRLHSAFQDCLYELLVVVESVFLRKLSPGQEPEQNLAQTARQCTQQLHRFLQERFQKISSRMEALLEEKVLSVPTNVLLPEDEVHRRHPQGGEEILGLEKSLAELQSSYQAEVCARQALLAELASQKEVQEDLDGLLCWIEELRSSWKQEGVGSMQDGIRLMVEMVGQLQDTMAKITKKSQGLV
ncbi:protein MIS12 homolog [Denticeps clupeoides]|uniref:Protein MIS12 homolog n=1 Tax=Denticeps clupeoides TaxID=299321 RepID=A0A8C3ZWW8_9TELE|nr:protein MIS12 homolog [Denticeps clupeoides]XP_028840331.1 protein MIS12 homolog [Denticeps clupeoides]